MLGLSAGWRRNTITYSLRSFYNEYYTKWAKSQYRITRNDIQVAGVFDVLLYSIPSRRNSGFCGIFSCLSGEENGFRNVSSCCSKTVGETCRNFQSLDFKRRFYLLRTRRGSIMISDLRTDAELSGIEKSSTMEEKT